MTNSSGWIFYGGIVCLLRCSCGSDEVPHFYYTECAVITLYAIREFAEARNELAIEHEESRSNLMLVISAEMPTKISLRPLMSKCLVQV